MDQLKRLLWLRCKINSRMAMGNKIQSISLFFFFSVVLVFWVLPISASAIANLIINSDAGQVESIHLLFFYVYLFWITVPVLGYRLSGGSDIGGISIYPVSPVVRIVANLAGSFLDIPFLLVLPIVVIPVTVYLWGNLTAMALGGLAVIMFLIHTVSLSQILVIWVRKLFGAGNFSRSVLTALVIFGALLLWGGGIPILCAGPSAVRSGELVLSDITVAYPCGLTAQSIALLKDHNYAAALYYIFLSVVLAGGTAWVGYRYSERFIRGEFENQEKRVSAKRGVWGNRLWTPLFNRLQRDQRAFVNLLSKDLTLLFREPQYRILVFVFILLTVAALLVFLLADSISSEDALIVYFFFMFPAAFSLGAISLNSMSLERSGLSWAITSPVTNIEILFSKALSVLVIQVPLFLISFFIFTIFTEISFLQSLVFALAGVSWFIISAGFNQIVAVLVPMPLPLEGVVQTNTPGPSRALYQSVGVFTVMALGTLVFSPVVGISIILLGTKTMGLWVLTLPVYCLFVPGAAAVGLLIASLFFGKRKERLIVEVVE